jgi:hypothetical protein
MQKMNECKNTRKNEWDWKIGCSRAWGAVKRPGATQRKLVRKKSKNTVLVGGEN